LSPPQSQLTASQYNRDFEYAEVTHPCHPLRGQRFRILKILKNGATERFRLQLSDFGILIMPRNWTDKAYPDIHAVSGDNPPLLSCFCLVELVTLIKWINEERKKEVDR
jgi:hypothetical protein